MTHIRSSVDDKQTGQAFNSIKSDHYRNRRHRNVSQKVKIPFAHVCIADIESCVDKLIDMSKVS